MKKILFYLSSILAFTSCATILSGSKAKVTLYNDEMVAPINLTVDGIPYPKTTLPTQVKVNRGYKPSVIIAESEKYNDTSVSINKGFNPTSLINIVAGGIIGIGVDAATGAITKPKDKNVYIPFTLKTEEKTIVQVPYAVGYIPIQELQNDNAQKPKSDALNNTIIRWYFESAPQGARIFWRIISSCPDEVKNTNELWLGNTPFEETRSFNIQGLTYENASNVQIEIKVRCQGYIDQSKRFNVRQAIDQQEISSFFDLVKETKND